MANATVSSQSKSYDLVKEHAGESAGSILPKNQLHPEMTSWVCKKAERCENHMPKSNAENAAGRVYANDIL